MSLPPLANVFALSSDDTTLLDRVESAAARAGSYRVSRRPGSRWLVAGESVPPGTPPTQEDAGIYFTEGRDLFDERQTRALRDAAISEPSTLGRHDGDFGFLCIDSTDRAAFVRSCGGRVPLYVRRAPSYIALGTRLSEIVRFTPGDISLDPLPCAIWAVGWPYLPDNRTFFRGITGVGRGHVATVTRERRFRVEEYWDPRPHSLARPTEERRREHVERCRELILGNLARELDPNGHNLLTLSGGVDSSSLAALAAGTLGYPVGTLSLLPTEEPSRSNEMTYIESLRSEYRFVKTWEFPLDFDGRIEAARSAPTSAFPMVHPALGLLPRVTAEHPVDVLFGGEFADHVCGSPYTYPDWIRHHSAAELARGRPRWPQGRRTLPRWVKHRLLSAIRRPYVPIRQELPDFVVAAAREEYGQWRADRRRALARDGRPLRYLALEADHDGFIAMNWEGATSVGARRAWPFFNRSMLELAFDCHPSELVGPDTKLLLRAALDGDVPPLNLHRRSRGHWDPPTTRVEPSPPPVPELAGVFDLDRLHDGEARVGLPISWVFRRFLDSVDELRRLGRLQKPAR
jgi:hypothetical protein